MIYNTACVQCCEGAASRCRQRVVIELPTHTGLTTCCDVKRLWIFYMGSSLLITLTLVLIGQRANSNSELLIEFSCFCGQSLQGISDRTCIHGFLIEHIETISGHMLPE